MGKDKVVEILCDFALFNKEANIDVVSAHANTKTLSASIKYMNDVQDVYTDSFVGFTTNVELANRKVRQIAQKLAKAIDENSVDDIKNIKAEYAETPEFAKAQKLLNEKCKSVWNVFETTDENIPYNAMKALGISNIPSLDFLLGNTIKYFEKDNCKTTSRTIETILNNKNLNYTINDIHNYLISKKAKLNFNTVIYLIEKHKYNKNQLEELNIEKSVMKAAFRELTLKNSLKFQLRNIKTIWKSYNISDLIILCK